MSWLEADNRFLRIAMETAEAAMAKSTIA